MNWPRLNTRPAIRRRRSWRPSLEEVEGRQLLSNTPLYVLGTNGNLRVEAPGWLHLSDRIRFTLMHANHD